MNVCDEEELIEMINEWYRIWMLYIIKVYALTLCWYCFCAWERAQERRQQLRQHPLPPMQVPRIHAEHDVDEGFEEDDFVILDDPANDEDG